MSVVFFFTFFLTFNFYRMIKRFVYTLSFLFSYFPLQKEFSKHGTLIISFFSRLKLTSDFIDELSRNPFHLFILNFIFSRMIKMFVSFLFYRTSWRLT